MEGWRRECLRWTWKLYRKLKMSKFLSKHWKYCWKFKNSSKNCNILIKTFLKFWHEIKSITKAYKLWIETLKTIKKIHNFDQNVFNFDRTSKNCQKTSNKFDNFGQNISMFLIEHQKHDKTLHILNQNIEKLSKF